MTAEVKQEWWKTAYLLLKIALLTWVWYTPWLWLLLALSPDMNLASSAFWRDAALVSGVMTLLTVTWQLVLVALVGTLTVRHPLWGTALMLPAWGWNAVMLWWTAALTPLEITSLRGLWVGWATLLIADWLGMRLLRRLWSWS